MPETSKIRVLIADDHPFFRDGLSVLMEATPDTELVGETTDGDEVVALAAELQPDVIQIDLRMPGPGGIEATRKILSTAPDTGILVVTMVEEDDSVFAAMRAGARGYLLKGADTDEMLLAIRAVARGEAVFGPGIARRLIQYFSARPQSAPASTSRTIFPELTDREREILDLVAAGHNNQEIAEKLFLSLKTVRNYVSTIFTELQVADRPRPRSRAGTRRIVGNVRRACVGPGARQRLVNRSSPPSSTRPCPPIVPGTGRRLSRLSRR